MTVQSELPGGFTGQAGYVATRQRDINQIMDANAGQVIGAGDAGRPLFQKFRRTGATGILSNPGWSNYDSLQTSLTRRMAQGFQVNIAYTWSRAFGICCDTLSDGAPQVQALDYFDLNEALLPQDRPHNFQASFVARVAVRPGQAVFQQWRSCRCDCRRMASEWVAQRIFRFAVFDQFGGHVVEHAGQQPDSGSSEGRS